MHPIAPTTTTSRTQVADLLATVAAANSRTAAGADGIVGSRTTVSLATLDRLTRLIVDLRPGAEARARLAQIDPALLLAGTSVWLVRRRGCAAAMSAADRAAARWGCGRA